MKFAGILFIIWVALLYDADGVIRRLVQPLRLAKPVMSGITRAVAAVLWPFSTSDRLIATFGTLV